MTAYRLIESHCDRCFLLLLVIASSKDSDIIDFKLFAKLNAFSVFVCDEKNNIAEIKIQGKISHGSTIYLLDRFFFFYNFFLRYCD